MIDELGIQSPTGKWSTGKVIGVLLIGAMILIFGIFVWKSFDRLNHPASFETAEIVEFMWSHKGALVRTADGRKFVVHASGRDFIGCRRGGDILLERRGESYSVAINGCANSGRAE